MKAVYIVLFIVVIAALLLWVVGRLAFEAPADHLDHVAVGNNVFISSSLESEAYRLAAEDIRQNLDDAPTGPT